MLKHVLTIANLRESLVMALAAIRASKLRSVLTVLGIVVGIFSIISVMTALGVLQRSIEEGITELGANTFQIQKYPQTFNGNNRGRYRNRKDITYEQAIRVKERATLAEEVGIEAWQGGRVIFGEYQKTNPNVAICGENTEGIVTNDWTVETGRSFSDAELDQTRMVAVLGKPVAEKLFPSYVDPVGQKIRFDGGVYQVIGVFVKKGGALGGNEDNFVCIPITTFFAKYGKEDRNIHIMVKALNRETVDDAIEQSRMILRAARHVPPGDEDDFSWFSNDSLIKQFNDLTIYLRLGVMVISSISLIAAGIGIMNIMLISVTERTKEIGIRKSIGARKSDILTQFMIEAVVLCEIGGVIGIILGIIGGNVVGVLMDVPAMIPWEWVGIGLLVCSVVGFAFGVYPAWKASSLDPIEALLFE